MHTASAPWRPGRLLLAGLVALLGVCLVGVGVHLLTQGREPIVAPEFGAAPASDDGAASPLAEEPPPVRWSVPSPVPGPDDVGRAAAHVALPTPPVEVSFSEAGVTAEVVPVGVLPTGALQIPDDPSRVGWWAAGASPGQAEGTVLLAGHMDGVRRGGAMSVLLDVTEGETVSVLDGYGHSHDFTIVARTVMSREALDPALFTTGGPHRLVLITCGGTFDEATGAYTENIVVVAEPAADDD